MQFPNEIGPAGFLGEFWQKNPLIIPGGIRTTLPTLESNELAWLATLPDVESRLVFTERRHGKTAYKVEHGPFEETALAALPERDWTLLVQDVDKHLPEFRRWFDLVPFVPDWRIDDLMISFAAPGGSVGPHVDNYDVFLCQVTGQREWRLTGIDKVRKTDRSTDLALLQAFAADRTWIANERDVLYLPPGVPHWGIAVDRCMTCSIGMRAPEWSEFSSASERLYPRRDVPVPPRNTRSPFYSDPDLRADEAAPGLINASALQRARAWVGMAGESDTDRITTIFGSMVTDPKAWLAPERIGTAEARRIAAGSDSREALELHGMAKIAYVLDANETPGPAQLFANGFHRRVDGCQTDRIARLCRQRRLSGEDLMDWRARPELRELLVWMLARGAFDLGDE